MSREQNTLEHEEDSIELRADWRHETCDPDRKNLLDGWGWGIQTERLALTYEDMVAQTGEEYQAWPQLIISELIENSLKACERVQTAPEIEITVQPMVNKISIADNGEGMRSVTINHIARRLVDASSPIHRGKDLARILLMPFLIDLDHAQVWICIRGRTHWISGETVHMALEEMVGMYHRVYENDVTKPGTSVSLCLGAVDLRNMASQILHIADSYASRIPYLSLRVDVYGSNEHGVGVLHTYHHAAPERFIPRPSSLREEYRQALECAYIEKRLEPIEAAAREFAESSSVPEDLKERVLLRWKCSPELPLDEVLFEIAEDMEGGR